MCKKRAKRSSNILTVYVYINGLRLAENINNIYRLYKTIGQFLFDNFCRNKFTLIRLKSNVSDDFNQFSLSLLHLSRDSLTEHIHRLLQEWHPRQAHLLANKLRWCSWRKTPTDHISKNLGLHKRHTCSLMV